ncbi:MAG: type III pantothenate kinase [Candidatus Omnitrophota bacterium]
MLLAVDIGNTNISLAVFKGSRIVKSWIIPVKKYRPLRSLGLPIKGALICSVAPQITRRLIIDIKKSLGIKPLIIGKNAGVPLKNLYQEPKQLGPDRLVNAYAASRIYSTPVVVVSCGTAITVDAVSKNKEYLGGYILPGIHSLFLALSLNTALLPKVKLTAPDSGIGRNTRGCILKGVILGGAGAIDALIEKIRLKTGKNTKVIGTGGDIELIKRFSKHKIKADKNLTLKGIFLTYKKIIKKT